jgi:hypothetical protein
MSPHKATDLASLSISPQELDGCTRRVRELKLAKWGMAYSRKLNRLLVKRISQPESAEAAAQELEKSLQAELPDFHARFAWGRGTAKHVTLFVNPTVLVLFKPGTTVQQRRKILAAAGVEPKQIEAHEDIEPPAKPGARERPRGRRERVAGFARKDAAKALKALERVERPGERARREAGAIVVPAARVRIPAEHREQAPELAARIAALPGVVAASADFDALGRDIAAERKFAAPPVLWETAVHEKNLVVPAWDLVDQADLGAPPATFIASREKVAVLDWDFFTHTNIAYQLVGFDAADNDADPTAPPPAPFDADGHAVLMAGIVGGTFTGRAIGIAPGANIVPVRPDFFTEADFVPVDGMLVPPDWDEFVSKFAQQWVDAILRLYAISFMTDVCIASMSFAANRTLWSDSGVGPWLNWWLANGNFGRGVFACASAGNNPDSPGIAVPAKEARVLAAGWGDYAGDAVLGTRGDGMGVVVDDGAWGAFTAGNSSAGLGGGMGSSGASAILAGTAAIMYSMNSELDGQDMREILELTTRKTASQLAGENAQGYSTTFGHGFLNAYYAIDVARKQFMPAAEVWAARLRAGAAPRALVQARLADAGAYFGRRSGMFWALANQVASGEQIWSHDRDPGLRHVDQAIDSWGMPFGELTLIGDFDGDGADELAIQLDAENFWPGVCDNPAQAFLGGKWDPAAGEVDGFGTRSPYASGLASPSIVFPGANAVRDIVCADLGGDGIQCPVAVQGNRVLNSLKYDAATGKFPAFTPVDFAVDPNSAQVHAATGSGKPRDRRLLKVARLGRIHGRDALLCVGEFGKRRFDRLDSVSARWGFADYLTRRYMTAFVLTYDSAAGAWVYEAFTADPQETHAVLESSYAASAEVESVEVGDFSAQPGTLQAVVHTSSGKTHFLTFFGGGAGALGGYAIYSQTLAMPGKAARLRSAIAGPDGARRQLMWLEDEARGNRVRFFRWNTPLRTWEDAGYSIWHARRENAAVDVAALDVFAAGGVATPPEVIAVLMEKPHRNAYHTFRWNAALGSFEQLGVM